MNNKRNHFADVGKMIKAVDVCPKIVNINNKCTAKKCGECRKNYWLAEVDENE